MAQAGNAALAAIQASNALFGRYCAVTIGGQQFTGNRVTFRIQKTYRKNPNPAEIVVYNLSETARNATSNRGTPITVVAGYVGSSAVLYTGEIVTFNHKREGPEWVSTFTCRDGDKAWLSYSSRSYAKGTPRLTIVQALASDMGFALTSDAQALISSYGSTRAAVVTHGHSFVEMDNQLQPLGLGWSIQDGQLQIVQLGGSTALPAILLNENTGLIQVPERMEEYHKPGTTNRGQPPQVRAKSLLQAAIAPGRQVRLESGTLTGYYTCLNVEHTGDTHGQDWTSTVEMQELHGG